MVVVKSSTTGKITAKRIQFTRRTECSTILTLSVNMDRKDNERPQPIKIAQLLAQSENSKIAPKNSGRCRFIISSIIYIHKIICFSVHKKIQPERLGTLSSIKNTEISGKPYGTSTCIKSVHFDKRVRRNLNFNEIVDSSTKRKNENTNKSISNKDKSIYEKDKKAVKKKSMLLPPNSIKNKYLKEETSCPKISKIPRKVDETNADSAVKEESKIIKMNSASSLHDESIGINVLPTVSPERIKTAKFLVPSQYKTPQQVTMNEDQLLTQNSSMHQKFTPNESNLQSKICTELREEDDCIEKLCNNLQDAQLAIAGNDTNAESGLSEMIYVNKDKIIRLEHDLKDLLNETEKNVLRLKSTLTCVTRLLSVNAEKIMLPNVDIKRGSRLMVEEGVEVETCKLKQCAEEKLKMPITDIPKITIADTELQDKENDKENIECINRRISDISFMELENQLNITHAKPAEEYSVQLKTPTVSKYKQKRSLREYMALKSSVSFLETPDGKKLRSLCQINDIDKFNLNATYISNKLLTDLNNLYSDSPESTL
ncbi:hypothetical protein ANTQUA_LOCUS7548 [Anthophora quadrimaculata]